MSCFPGFLLHLKYGSAARFLERLIRMRNKTGPTAMFVPLTTHGVETGEYVSIDLELLAVNFHSFPRVKRSRCSPRLCIDYVGGYEVRHSVVKRD